MVTSNSGTPAMAGLPLSGRPVAIDFTAAHEQGAGIGRLVRDLIGQLAIQDTHTVYKLFVAGATADDLDKPPGSNFMWHPSRITPRWFARLWHKARLYMPVELFVGHNIALYHATDFTLPPTLPGRKTILTVHDLSFVRAPEAAFPAQKAFLDKAVPWSVSRATHIIADSAATKLDLMDVYDTPEAKISVLLSGIDPRFRTVTDADKRKQVRQHYGIPQGVPYIFSIGTVQPRKNYQRAIEALQILGDRYRDIHYVVAGGKGWLEAPIYSMIEASGLKDRIHFIGFVDDADVPALYSDAIMTWYVSLYEGFGFPVLESMACSTPVLTANVSSLPEVAGDAALMVSPTDVNEIAEAMQQLLDNAELRDTLIARGHRQIKPFTWERAAKELLAIYASVLDT